MRLGIDPLSHSRISQLCSAEVGTGRDVVPESQEVSWQMSQWVQLVECSALLKFQNLTAL